MEDNLKRRFFATYYDTPARVVYGGEDLHIECDGWYPGLLEGDLEGYYLLLDQGYLNKRDYTYSARAIYGLVDKQRSEGIAVPFMDMDVQQLIDLGWIKLR